MSLTRFDGATYQPELDYERLSRQHRRVRAVMSDGRWRTLAEIAALTGDPQASISARLRDLRKLKFGGFIVARRRRDELRRGIFEYCVSDGNNGTETTSARGRVDSL